MTYLSRSNLLETREDIEILFEEIESEACNLRKYLKDYLNTCDKKGYIKDVVLDIKTPNTVYEKVKLLDYKYQDDEYKLTIKNEVYDQKELEIKSSEIINCFIYPFPENHISNYYEVNINGNYIVIELRKTRVNVILPGHSIYDVTISGILECDDGNDMLIISRDTTNPNLRCSESIVPISDLVNLDVLN